MGTNKRIDMKKIVLILFVLFIQTTGVMADTHSEAKQCVIEFYQKLDNLVQNPNGDKAFYYVNDLMSLCADNEIRFPNDIKFLRTDYDDNLAFVTAIQYTQQLQDMAKIGNLKIDISKIEVQDMQQAGLDKQDKISSYLLVKLNKTITYRGSTKTFIDTVTYNKLNKKITLITNNVAQYTDDDIFKTDNVNQLMAIANMFYNKGKKYYPAAYKAYYRAAELGCKDPDMYYRLGIMVLKKEGCGDKALKVRDIEAEYWLSMALIYLENSTTINKLYNKLNSVIIKMNMDAPTLLSLHNNIYNDSNSNVPYTEGYIRYTYKYGVGYINQEGQLIDKVFKVAGPFKNGIAKVIDMNGQEYYIDKQGNKINNK
jgi:TPR repeat protein